MHRVAAVVAAAVYTGIMVHTKGGVINGCTLRDGMGECACPCESPSQLRYALAWPPRHAFAPDSRKENEAHQIPCCVLARLAHLALCVLFV